MATSGVFRAEVDSENPWVASCRVGVPYDLDRAYKVTMKAVLRIFELGRTATAFERDWCGLKSLFQRGAPWLLKAQEVLVYPSAAKVFIPQAEVRMEMELSAVGQRSFAIESRLVHEGTGNVLMVHRCSCIVTRIDKATGKRASAPLPSWFLEGLPHLVEKGGGPAEAWPRRLEPQQGPGHHVCWRGHVTVRPSDTDGNGHVNNACYVTMAEDAVADAARAGRLPGFRKGDVAGQQVRCVQVQYEREAFWGDELEVRLLRLGTRDENDDAGLSTRPVSFEIRRPSSHGLLLVLGVLTYAPANVQQQNKSRL